MFTILSSFLKIPFINTLGMRIVNKYTGGGVTLILLELENLGVFPQGTYDRVTGIPFRQLYPYLIVSVGIWLVFHMPKFKSKVERLQEQIDILKLEKELKDLTEDNSNKNERKKNTKKSTS